jgi:farnesyl-diphosphate farnesyltransferase
MNALGGELLAKTSRSFYLTLKALPVELREPISLGYLLARISDTLADTAAVAAGVRAECLETFAGLLPAADVEGEERFQAMLMERFVPLQEDAAEAALLGKVREAVAWLRTVAEPAQGHIQRVLQTILKGQRLDVERFPDAVELRSLKDRGELGDYTYQVAGCVGEFWTELCVDLLPGAFTTTWHKDELVMQGIRFGKGLQLINILRDIRKDAAMGRCYLPQDGWQALGLTAQELQAHPERLRPVWETELVEAEQCMVRAGLYVQQIGHKGLRYATALPWLLGVRTLNKLRCATDAELMAGVKVSRAEVAKLLAQVAWHNTPEGLRKLASA